MKLTCLIAMLAVGLLTSCSPASREATHSNPQQLANEWAAALNAKHYTKAQALASQATAMNRKCAEAWAAYGIASVELGQTDHARQAYERALSLYQARHKQNPSDANQVFQQIFLLALLGRQAEAEILLKQAHVDYPNDQEITKAAEDYTKMRKGLKTWAVGVKP